MQDNFERLFELLKKYDVTFSSAESLTGGMFGEKFTAIPGASDFYWGGIVSYAPDSKIRVLGVPAEFIKKHTVVSREVVKAMTNGILAISGTDVAIAVTGIAGPNGGTDEHPAGTVWAGVAFASGETVEKKFEFTGSREDVRVQTCDSVCDLLCNLIEKKYAGESIA